jgi:hypothetical protein
MIITLGPELEAALKELACRQGVAPEVLARNALRERLLGGAATNYGVFLPHAASVSEGLHPAEPPTDLAVRRQAAGWKAEAMDAGALTSTRATPLVVLAAAALLAGAGGMAVSVLFLAARSHLDVIAGAVGFLAGAVLLAAGLLSLVVQSRSPSASQAAVRIAGCLAAFLPPLVAALAWPVLYFGLFLLGLPLTLLVLIGCAVWAWAMSESVASHLSALFGWSRKGVLQGLVFAFELIAILASWPLFVSLLAMLESMGYKVGWS